MIQSFERNADIVKMVSYGTMFNNADTYFQLRSNALMPFDKDRVVASASYHVQQMFAESLQSGVNWSVVGTWMFNIATTLRNPPQVTDIPDLSDLPCSLQDFSRETFMQRKLNVACATLCNITLALAYSV